MSTIHFIGGEKGGVGKSVVARLCAQYCIDRAIPFVAADADGSHGALLRFYADYTRPVDLSESESADAILGLATESERRVLVDLPAQSDRLLAAWIKEAGILELAAESGVRVVFWHVMDDGKDALTTLDRVLSRYGDGRQLLRRQEPGTRARLLALRSNRRRATPPNGWARGWWSCPSSTPRRCRRSIARTRASGPPSTAPRPAATSLHPHGSPAGQGVAQRQLRSARQARRPVLGGGAVAALATAAGRVEGDLIVPVEPLEQDARGVQLLVRARAISPIVRVPSMASNSRFSRASIGR